MIGMADKRTDKKKDKGTNKRTDKRKDRREHNGKLRLDYTKKAPRQRLEASCKSVAATYSPTWWGSTIGDGELNFSVRNGKRWILTAITATICVLRKNNSISNSIQVPSLSRSCFPWLSLCLFYFTPPNQGPSRPSNKLHRGRCRAISTARL